MLSTCRKKKPSMLAGSTPRAVVRKETMSLSGPVCPSRKKTRSCCRGIGGAASVGPSTAAWKPAAAAQLHAADLQMAEAGVQVGGPRTPETSTGDKPAHPTAGKLRL